jgi:hypothetical protein
MEKHRRAESQIDHSSVVVEELTTVARNLHGNTIGILDVLLPQLLEHAAETIVPPLLFLGSFAGVCGAELHEEFVACDWFPKLVCVYQQQQRGTRLERKKDTGLERGRRDKRNIGSYDAPVIATSLKC